MFGLALWFGCSAPPDRSARSDADVSDVARQDSAAALEGADSVIAAARQLYRRGEYDSVRALLDPALERTRATADSNAQARIITLLGQTAYQEGDLESAQTLGEQALELKLAIGLHDDLSHSYNALGLVAWYQGRRTDALELYDRVLEYAPADSAERWSCVVAINRGLIYTDLGDFTAARAAFEQGREIAHAAGDARLEGAALNNLAMLDIWIGNPKTAIATLELATEYYRAQGTVPGEINALGQLGTAHTALGQLGEAMVVLDSAVRLARERGMRTEEAGSLEALAEVYRTAGDYRRALELYAEAEAINLELGLPDQIGRDQRSRAEIYASLGEVELARDYARRALETHRSVGARWEELADLVLLADLDHEAGDTLMSIARLSEARELARECDARVGRIDVALAEARIADRHRDPTWVLTVLAEASNDLYAGGYDAAWEAEALKSRAYASLGQLDSAVATGRRAVEAVERVRVALGAGRLRTSYTAQRPEPYAELVNALRATGDIEEAFAVADAARGRALLEHMATRSLSTAGQATSVKALEKGEALLRQVARLSAEIDAEELYPPEERELAYITELQAQLAAARAEYETWHTSRAETDSTAPDGLALRVLSAAEVRGALLEREALLQYFVMPDRVVGFVATAEETRAFETVISDERLSRRVRIARDLLSDPTAQEGSGLQVLSGLYGVLVAPALTEYDLSDIERLIVVPHGVLNYLPFAALIDGSSGRYLAEDYVLRLLPSASSLPLLRAARSEAEAADAWKSGVAFAPFPEQLPATRAEARAFRTSVPRGRSVEGRRATEQHVREQLGEAPIVHVATHGIMNVHNPMFSHIELAGGGADRSTDDGRLEVHEVLDVPVRSQLVFLSGCETGLGHAWSTGFERGEDYSTLAQAFLYAGAANVVATLWRVADQGAAEFAQSFYNHLSAAGPSRALAAAQREMMSHPQYSEPYYWAAYQLVGAGDPMANAQERAVESVRY
jgi:CHAT domain-containing protein/Tfp pilus assembly protein PilF